MLNFFRRRDTAVRFVLGGMLVLICVAMVMYLIPGLGSNNSAASLPDQTVASVNGVPITSQALVAELQRLEQGQQIPPNLAPMFGQQILRNLVIEQALAAEAQKLGLVATDQEVADAARTQAPQLYPNGVYVGDDAAAQAIGSAFNMTLTQFQERLREDVAAQKVYTLITDPVRVTDDDLNRQFARDNTKIKFDYVFLKPADMESQIAPTPEQLQAYYKDNLSKYQAPEKRKLELVLANTAQIAPQINVTDAQVDQYYRQNLASYQTPERVKAAHILLKTANQTPAEQAATKAKAEDILKQLKAGADFATLAKKYSQDDATAPQGGELGWIQHGQMVKNFDATVFSTPPGQLSDVIQTEYGYHIVKVEAHEKARLQPESEVKDQIVQQLQNEQAASKAQTLINRAQALAAGSHTPLADIASQLGLQYFSPPPVGRTDPLTGIGVNTDFANAVFSTSAGGLTPPVQVAQGFAMARVDQIIPPAAEPFDQVKDQVTADYKQQKEQDLVKSEAQQLAQAAQKQGLKAAAAAMHFKVESSDALTRAGSLKDAGAISSFADTLFSLAPGSTGPATALGDNEIVYTVDSVQPPSPADFIAQSTTVMNSLLQQRRNAVFQAYEDALLQSLNKSGKLTYNAAAFKAAVGGDDTNTPNFPGAPKSGNPFGT